MKRVVASALPLVVLFALTWTPSAWARTVKIESAAPLSDRSDRAVDDALKHAVDKCVQRATAMGMSWIWLDDAAVLGDKVFVKMVATDEDAGEDADEVRVIDPAPGQHPAPAEAGPSTEPYPLAKQLF